MNITMSKSNKRSKHIPTSLNSFNRMKKYSSSNMKRKPQRGMVMNPVKKRKGNGKGKKILYICIGVLFFIICGALIAAGVYLKNLQNSLPSPDELVNRTSDQSTQIFDRNGQLLYTVYGDQNREFVPIDQIPDHTKWAVLAAEDIEFYQHKGLDYAGIVMSFVQNLRKGTIVRGASTITQQLVKNTILYDILGDEIYQQTYSRKIKEILVTMQVEQTFTKDQILQMYMNEIPLGGVNYGFQAAAHAYFGKDVKDLTLAESALIAGLIQGPGIYSPLFGTNPELAKVRQTYVLDQMLKHKDLTGVTKEEIDAAKKEELVYKTKKIDIKAPHFVFYVKQQLENEYGVDRVERGGLKVTTSLDYSIQEIAEEEVKNGIAKRGMPLVHNGAAVVLDPKTGEVLAMVGSVDYWNTQDPKVDGNVNVTTSLRQVGSSAKPYVYLAAFEKGYGPWTLAPDIKMSFGNYSPDDSDNQFEGLGTIRRNLGRSRNLPAVYTLQMIGVDSFLQMTDKLGITTLKDKSNYGLSLALGAGEMKLIEHAGAFTTFANEGIKHDTISILKVEDSKGNVLKDVKEFNGKQVVDAKDVYLLNYILCDLGGHGDRIGGIYTKVKGVNVCFKTGTTDGPRDLTTVMYHKNLVVAVWAGNNDNSVGTDRWGVSVPLPIANSIMTRLADKYKVELFTRPSGILSTAVCRDTGAIPADGVNCEKEATVYISGQSPQIDNRESVPICISNGLIPTNLEQARAFNLVQDKVYMTFQLENAQQRKTYQEFLMGIANSPYIFEKPASGICPLPLGPDNSPVIDLNTPKSGQSYKVNENMEINGSVRFSGNIVTFTIAIDGNTIPSTINSDKFSASYSFKQEQIGSHTLVITATDNQNKVGTLSIPFTVTANSPVNPPVNPPNPN